jgi:hypothetical protein
MGLPASEQFVLSAIENELQTTDPELTIAFASFARGTDTAQMPVTEQLGTGRPLAGVTSIGRERRTGMDFVLVLAMLFVFGALLAVGTVIVF